MASGDAIRGILRKAGSRSARGRYPPSRATPVARQSDHGQGGAVDAGVIRFEVAAFDASARSARPHAVGWSTSRVLTSGWREIITSPVPRALRCRGHARIISCCRRRRHQHFQRACVVRRASDVLAQRRMNLASGAATRRSRRRFRARAVASSGGSPASTPARASSSRAEDIGGRNRTRGHRVHQILSSTTHRSGGAQ